MEKIIQWYPGHMARAIRLIQEKLSAMDLVIEVIDARAPRSSINQGLRAIIGVKPLLLVMNKADLADPKMNDIWLKELNKEEMTISLDSVNGSKNEEIIEKAILVLLKNKIQKAEESGRKIYPLKAMVVGIPNSGKSTLMNNLAKRKAMMVGDTPGVTKNMQYLKASDKLVLLDNPGVLWPKFSDQNQGKMLALIGSIKEDIAPIPMIAEYGITVMSERYPSLLKNRYSLDDIKTPYETLEAIGKRRGCLIRGGEVDMDKTYDVFLRDLRSGRIGRVTFESPSESI